MARGNPDFVQFRQSLTEYFLGCSTFIISNENNTVMNTNKYQVWEGETEAAGLEENGVSFISAIFSVVFGILLFFVLIGKTILESIFNTKFGVKRNASSALKTSELKMSVS